MATEPERYCGVFPSELGYMALCWRGQRLLRLTIGHPSAAAASTALSPGSGSDDTVAPDFPGWIEELVGGLQRFAAGQDVSFTKVPLELAHLSEFQTRVVRACRQIRRGQVRAYGELAAAVGAPRAARAVGSTMARNRFPIIVPCHRVVAADGALGGFTAREGVILKQRMLALEGAPIGLPQRRAGRKPR